MPLINRRNFFEQCLATIPLTGMLGTQMAIPKEQSMTPPLIVFSKHLQFLDYPDLAKTCKHLGLDGIDLTVRPGGHVKPERVQEDLPKAADAIRSEGLVLPMITTRYVDTSDPWLHPVLSTAKACGISYCRIGGQHYKAGIPILEQIHQFTEEIRSLVHVMEGYGITAGYHNHSGENYFGAPVWDLHQMYETINSPYLGANFDVGHAVVEGAYGDWEITARLIAPWVKMVAVKDFVFTGAKPKWVPLGEGIVDIAAFLKIFRETAGFAGPISLHFEYSPGSNDALLQDIQQAVRYMRTEVLPRAGYTVVFNNANP